jgi:mono/diheme cytochrome c family protein/Fe2+ or Zn2+ uptake regulation protein
MFDDATEYNAVKGTLYVVLGPIFGMLYVFLLPLIALLTLLVALPGLANAKKAAIVENAPMCMSCHSSQGLVKVFKNKEKLSVFVNAPDFRNTAHSFLNCTDCHKKISMATHPGRVFDSKSAFALDATKSCRSCHTRAELKAKPIHAYLTNRTHGPPCTQCHGAHDVKRIADWRPAEADNQYCLTCHQQKMTKTLNNGEKISLFINSDDLEASVHSRHACSDCHSEFSRKSHPVKEFNSIREHSIEVSGVCKRCHSDKHTAVRESIHSKMIDEGNLNAPVCTDCHGFHSVGPKATYETLSGVPCRRCHDEVFRVYEGSVHGKARLNGEHKAPLCSSCHFAHEVKVTAMTEKIKSACLGCHTEAEAAHDKWLPNSSLHLSAVSCAACHSPDSGRGIYLRLYDENTGEPFSEEQIIGLLEVNSDELGMRMDAHGDGIDSDELWNIVKKLNEKGADARVTFLGRMDVASGREAHQLSYKKDAVRQCESCHQAGSDFFKNVTVAVVKADGRVARYDAKPEVLGSMVSLLSLKEFYVLGSTRLKVLDWIGILMVFGGASVPLAHITLRILTSPIREAKRLNKLRKGDKR